MVETTLVNTPCIENVCIPAPHLACSETDKGVHRQVLQHAVFWQIMLYTGGRPGSFLSTKRYKEWYMKYKVT